LAFSNWQRIVKACYHRRRLSNRKPFLRGKIITVLGPRSIAANFRLVVDGFAISKGAQEIETLARALFGFELKCVISRVSAILDRSEWSILRVGPIGLIESGTWSGDLVAIYKDLRCVPLEPT